MIEGLHRGILWVVAPEKLASAKRPFFGVATLPASSARAEETPRFPRSQAPAWERTVLEALPSPNHQQITRLRPAQPMTRTRYRFGEDYYPHFMTNTAVAWLPVFSDPCFAEVIFDSWQFLQREREIDILAYVLMENHTHWIAVGPLLSKRVGEFKSYTATAIIQRMKEKKYQTLLQELKFYKLRHKIDQTYQLWQEGSHPQCLESENVLRQKIEYTHYNPVRRGYVDDPVHWRYSSARQYAGQPGLVEVCMDWL